MPGPASSMPSRVHESEHEGERGYYGPIGDMSIGPGVKTPRTLCERCGGPIDHDFEQDTMCFDQLLDKIVDL